MADMIEREEATVIPARGPRRSRLPAPLRVPILVVLNLGINALLWQTVANFVPPELGFVSKAPTDDDVYSLFSPVARLITKVLTIYATWAVGYDFYDVSALTLLTNVPYAYLLSTYYQISTLTVAAHMNIEVLSIAIPTYLLRSRAPAHRASVPLRNRFLLDSVQVQFSNALLAICVYVVVIWGGLKTGLLNSFLVTYFDIPTLEAAHLETPITVAAKIFTAGFAAKGFLLNPSIAAQTLSGQTTPVANFDATTADLQATLKHNFWYFGRRTRTLIQQTWILCFFLVLNTVQRCLTLNGAEFTGAAGYAGIWAVANAIIAVWFAWVGDTSTDYVVN
ncbi:hypothetical protein C7974DRAFT_177560 [Boeremia exigua]|uniref:uncharacterized protein n=1 Tax=Boeremia exigua TaxID=749465 RepID=UPI001E8ECDE1|nr:uncharacterized protein C7974DRAFT_177560 [Boeremia exigua]KAH6633742.1 hypothetical protein C7974DRAFT_177560 [Boeremia exigua]